MKLVSIVLGQAIRLIKAYPPPGGIYMPDAVKALQDRYGFVQVPTTLEGYDPARGVTISHGKFSFEGTTGTKEIVIDSFQIFDNGVLVNTKAYTEEADLFLDDVIKWITDTFGSSIYPLSSTTKIFSSMLEIKTDVSLDSYFPKSNKVGKQISEMLKDFGFKTPSYNISSFSMHFDIHQKIAPIPAAFSLSRRENQPYSSNLYFSSAPLLTSQHIGFLRSLEKEVSK